jgi:uncharacterized YigZ family protein
MILESYKSICSRGDGLYKSKGSKFLGFAFPVEDEEEIKTHLAELRKSYYDATHHCYAYRLSSDGSIFRANDDGEPANTAGKPILGKLLSLELTHVLVVVIRYYGGTQLGVRGLIDAYKLAAEEALLNTEIIDIPIEIPLQLTFGYELQNEVNKQLKGMGITPKNQKFDEQIYYDLRIPQSKFEEVKQQLFQIFGLVVK